MFKCPKNGFACCHAGCGPAGEFCYLSQLPAEAAVIASRVTIPARLLSALASNARKEHPMAAGLLDYFPDALALVANISFRGNQKHNPGEDLHWSRGKSNDHADCILRHLVERGTHDPDGIRHSAQLAWRSLALLQEELEKDLELPLPRGARAPAPEPSLGAPGTTPRPAENATRERPA